MLSHLVSVFIIVIGLVACTSQSEKSFFNPHELKMVYVEDYKNVSLDILFERGHNLHRIYAFHKYPSPELHIFHDKKKYKSLRIKEEQFKELLSKSIDTAGAFSRKLASKDSGRCRTPFVIKVVNSKEKLEVEGCRSSDEGVVFGKLIAEIEHLASINSIQ